jgi:hypothetical protein
LGRVKLLPLPVKLNDIKGKQTKKQGKGDGILKKAKQDWF